MTRPYWKVGEIATIAKITANERKASRFGLATLLATVAKKKVWKFVYAAVTNKLCSRRPTDSFSILKIRPFSSRKVGKFVGFFSDITQRIL